MLGAESPSLERRLGPFDAAAIVISNVIGVGIFITPGFIATLLPNRAAILGVWAIGGVLALFGALAYAELAARFGSSVAMKPGVMKMPTPMTLEMTMAAASNGPRRRSKDGDSAPSTGLV